jgi:hypothetical protein
MLARPGVRPSAVRAATSVLLGGGVAVCGSLVAALPQDDGQFVASSSARHGRADSARLPWMLILASREDSFQY